MVGGRKWTDAVDSTTEHDVNDVVTFISGLEDRTGRQTDDILCNRRTNTMRDVILDFRS